MFYFIGLGLGDASDITVKGLQIVKSAKRVYLEAYTSILTDGGVLWARSDTRRSLYGGAAI